MPAGGLADEVERAAARGGGQRATELCGAVLGAARVRAGEEQGHGVGPEPPRGFVLVADATVTPAARGGRCDRPPAARRRGTRPAPR